MHCSVDADILVVQGADDSVVFRFFSSFKMLLLDSIFGLCNWWLLNSETLDADRSAVFGFAA